MALWGPDLSLLHRLSAHLILLISAGMGMDPYAAYYAGQGYGWPDASQYPGAGRNMANDIISSQGVHFWELEGAPFVPT